MLNTSSTITQYTSRCNKHAYYAKYAGSLHQPAQKCRGQFFYFEFPGPSLPTNIKLTYSETINIYGQPLAQPMTYNYLIFWRDSNDKPSTSHTLGHGLYWNVSQQLFIGPDCFVIRDVLPVVMYCQCLLGGSSVTIQMGKGTLSRLGVSASLGLLQYRRVSSNNNDGLHIIFIVCQYIY